MQFEFFNMYLAGYITGRVRSLRGRRTARAVGREPTDGARGAEGSPGDGGRAGRAAADRPAGCLPAPSGTARGRAGGRTPRRSTAGLQPAAGATVRSGRVARSVPRPVGAAAARPAHRDRPRTPRTKEKHMTSVPRTTRVV